MAIRIRRLTASTALGYNLMRSRVIVRSIARATGEPMVLSRFLTAVASSLLFIDSPMTALSIADSSGRGATFLNRSASPWPFNAALSLRVPPGAPTLSLFDQSTAKMT